MSMLLIEVAKQLRISPYNVTYPIKIDVSKHLAYADHMIWICNHVLLNSFDSHFKYVGSIIFCLAKLFIKS